MEESSIEHAKYWRNSLADAELGRGRFQTKEAGGFLRLAEQEVATGHVSNAAIEKCFRGEGDVVRTVEVVIRPKVYLFRVEHGEQRRSGVPEIVTPIVTRALLARDGRLYPLAHTVVPRDILEPLGRGSFVIGTVADQDEFLTKNVPPRIVYCEEDQSAEADFENQWSSYVGACERLFEHVGQGWPRAEDGFEMADYGYLIKEGSIKGTRLHIIPLYDHIRDNNPSAPLFDRYASIGKPEIQRCLPANAGFSARLGHPSDQFPLVQAQRDSLAHLLVAEAGEILAVNGPPGTGKTTLLLSVVASLWAKAALEGSEPPIILAASTNNQAVTNIIDAFGKDFSKGTGQFADRWLPNIKSFGAYFGNRDKEARNEDKYQTRSFFERIEAADYVAKAEAAYLQAGKRPFPEIAPERMTVEAVVTALRQAIKKEAEKLELMERAWPALTAAREAIRAELGDDPDSGLAERRQQLAITKSEKYAFGKLKEQWEEYLAQESIFYSLFSWLAPVRTKRMRLARMFLKKAWPPSRSQEEWQSIEQIESRIKVTVDKLDDVLQEQRVRLQRAEDLLQLGKERLGDWRWALTPLGMTENAEHSSLAECDAIADTRIRFTIFLLTTHFWEGRWLIDMQELQIDKKTKNNRMTVEKRWGRRMKLTPCIVSTFFMLPSEMKFSRDNGHDLDDYLYDFADLLIVDEAGQVLPEVAGASFALSKKALVIGDTFQIEPTWSIPARVDVGNLISTGLIPEKSHDAAYDHFSDTGKSAASGSVMRIAQRVTRYHYDLGLPRGLFLYEHRRCFDEIIKYSNELCYQNKLIPKRGAKADADKNGNGLPALGYLHIDGICQQSNGGSRRNLLEAETVAAWLDGNKNELETKYERPLCRIVGVVTPFDSQVRAITRACAKLRIKVGDKKDEMTVGTVHSLQGAERPIVIFSSVYSKHSDGRFIDKSPSMLNVAVSRAEDSFLVFGDMDVFEVASKTAPRERLAALLFQDPANALHFEYRLRQDLKSLRTEVHQLRDAQEHDSFLLETLAKVSREINIVTPWIRLECIEEIGAMEAMSAAIQRGIKVSIYTDPEFNTTDNDPKLAAAKRQKLRFAVDALSEKGIETVFVGRVHSKAVIGDDELYCVGSFNWFSASRDSRYARHETSLVYRGLDLASEIEIMRRSLKQRITRWRQ